MNIITIKKLLSSNKDKIIKITKAFIKQNLNFALIILMGKFISWITGVPFLEILICSAILEILYLKFKK